ncbi:MAG: hypothetical protein Q8N55_04735 [bacterium]|nr:hypothetical protein [bacterium]
MLTAQDIKKLSGVLATKKEYVNMAGLREIVQTLAISVDKLVKEVSGFCTINQVNRHEKWIKLIAEKTGVKLEY